MKSRISYSILFCFFILSNLSAQVPGIKQDFNDGSIVGWEADHPATFGLSAADSALKIDYNRSSSSGAWDNFNYSPPDVIDPASNPIISIKVKSSVPTQVTCKPIYSNGTDGWLQKNVDGNNEWSTLNFELIKSKGTTISKIYWYLDGGSSEVKSGTVYFDDFSVGSDKFIVNVSNLKADVTDTTRVELSWDATFAERIKYFKLFRSEDIDFVPDESSLLDTTSQQAYIDTNLNINTTYYYRVSAIDIDDQESEPSSYTKARTYSNASKLSISTEHANVETPGLYELYELSLLVENANYENPYDPDQVDISALFTAPSGKEWLIYGFYDNASNVATWKVRFSPNEEGEWGYRLKIINQSDTASSIDYKFTAVTSTNHGWLTIKDENPYYFQHDDGTSFYGVGAFYPWNVKKSELELMNDYGANLWAYWNIMYDDGRIIESIYSGVGQYDQYKAQRIDDLLTWSADRDMKMMLSIWPHDLISNTVWAHQWNNNPYNTICDVKDWFTDETAWEYQKKQYRYIIARWGAFRSLGILEIVNEINGTDAWAAGKNVDGRFWVKKVNDYLKEHDPYGHPTTASQSGGKYWTEGYSYVDVPNVHLYETGWNNIYIFNKMRGSLYIYGKISRDFRKDFAAPAFMGEAGYKNTYGNWDMPSPEYTELYHNALYSTWANGNASTPMWWEFNDKNIMSTDVLRQMKTFSKVASQFDYAKNKFQAVDANVIENSDKYDLFVMAADTIGFGWIREDKGGDLSGVDFEINGLPDTLFTIQFLDAWKGNFYRETLASSENGKLTASIPNLTNGMRDLVLVIKAVDDNYTDIASDLNNNIPNEITLEQNYPNPFNPETTIKYSLPKNSHVKLVVFDMLGREVARLVNEVQSAGWHNAKFSSASVNHNLTSGIYIYSIQVGDIIKNRKMMLLK